MRIFYTSNHPLHRFIFIGQGNVITSHGFRVPWWDQPNNKKERKTSSQLWNAIMNKCQWILPTCSLVLNSHSLQRRKMYSLKSYFLCNFHSIGIKMVSWSVQYLFCEQHCALWIVMYGTSRNHTHSVSIC